MPFDEGQCRPASASRLTYNLVKLLRTHALPEETRRWSLNTLREKMVKSGARSSAAPAHDFQMAEVAVSRDLWLSSLTRMISAPV
jgi:hypothetical protein